MKIMITGANGQLGSELVNLMRQTSFEAYAYTKEELDITNDKLVIEEVDKVRPDVIINAAAFTKVDLAEEQEDLAYAVNAYGQRNLAAAAERIGSKVCYISTDYVFDGQGNRPYREYDTTNPLGVYGGSKYAGEELTKQLSSKFFIIRTAWVYGEYGPNFVKTMLNLAQKQKELGVVADQNGSPTYTLDLAEFIVELIQTDRFGTYHATNSGSCSWFEFAEAIFEIKNMDIKVNQLTTEQFPRPAKRPQYSVLDNFALRVNGFKELRHWKLALAEFLSANEK